MHAFLPCELSKSLKKPISGRAKPCTYFSLLSFTLIYFLSLLFTFYLWNFFKLLLFTFIYLTLHFNSNFLRIYIYMYIAFKAQYKYLVLSHVTCFRFRRKLVKFMSRIVERNETVMEKIVNTEEKLCQKWMFRSQCKNDNMTVLLVVTCTWYNCTVMIKCIRTTVYYSTVRHR